MKRIHFYIVNTKLYFSQKVINSNQQKMKEIKKKRMKIKLHAILTKGEEKMAKIRSKKKTNCYSHDGLKRRRFSSFRMALFRSFATPNYIAWKNKKKHIWQITSQQITLPFQSNFSAFAKHIIYVIMITTMISKLNMISESKIFMKIQKNSFSIFNAVSISEHL